MSADTLSPPARAFYEQVRFKMAASIFLAGLSMVSLAYVSSYGGESNSANFMVNHYNNIKALTDDELENSYAALAGGYGALFF